RWEGGSLVAEWHSRHLAGDEPMRFRVGTGDDGTERILLDLPLPESTMAALPESVLDATSRVRHDKAELVLRSRTNSAEHYARSDYRIERQPIDDATFTIVQRVVSRIDPEIVAGGSPLPNGAWDVLARATCCGVTLTSRLGG